jgi:multiple sugar transport system permease protein
VVACGAVALGLTLALPAAYAFSRYRFRGRDALRILFLVINMFPVVMLILPLFLVFRTLGLLDTYFALIAGHATFTLPFAIWMLTGYFDNIPRDLDEAAKVDGASALTTLFRVILPVARPGVIAVVVYSFITAWGELLFAEAIVGQFQNLRTLAVGLTEYSSETAVFWNQIMAASLVVSVPVVVGFLLLQRNFVAGLSAGAVK